MEFHENRLYHIYNRGNNRRKVFFSDENYKYFLWKMQGGLKPFGDLIAYSLMPNHYHWLFFVKKNEIERAAYQEHANAIEFLRRKSKYGPRALPVDLKLYRSQNEKIDLNESIGKIQSAYSQAINKENGWSGSLFQKPFKAKDGWIAEFISEKDKNGKLDFRFSIGNDYANTCMKYIHQNAVEASLVSKAEDWEFSSSQDYAGLRNGTLCNIYLALPSFACEKRFSIK